MKVLTLKEAAKRIRMSDRHLRRLALEGKIPAFRVGTHWRFPDMMLDEWVRAQCQPTQSVPQAQ